MISIQFPDPSFRTKQVDEQHYIFDALRRRWLLLTPEEWVRQNFISYLVSRLHYPAELIAVEKRIRLGELTKRFDILVYDRSHRPWMIVECKADTVALTEDTLLQALRYNVSVPVPYIIITNGKMTYGWKKLNGNLSAIAEVPEWE